jgi:radical SAM protein with 4Fe4S-binding SPASM domain
MGILQELRARGLAWGSSHGRPRAGDAAFPEPGLYHYLREDAIGKARMHLRVEGDGSGLLLVNASRVYHLNPTAAGMAYLYLEKQPAAGAARAVARRYRVSSKQAMADFQAFAGQMEVMTHPDEHCPVCELALDLLPPFSTRPSAPYRMDLALTYRCNNNCAHCYNARPRSHPELSAGQWKHILDILWQQGIPHVVFTGGEPTLRDDLPELVAHAERNGQITGINTNGRRLKDPAYLQALIDAGLDHVQITFESHDPAIHDEMVRARGAWEDTLAGLRAALSTRLYVMSNTTLLRSNAPALAETLDFLAEVGVPKVGLNALIYSGRGLEVGSGLRESELPPLLAMAREKIEKAGQELIWYTPTAYCNFDPIQLELGVKGCTAALYNMCVEPDGNVLPCQSYYTPVGNLLLDSWDRIWNHDLSVTLRERKDAPLECQVCALMETCGGGCPLARTADPHLRPRAITDEALRAAKPAIPEGGSI